MPRLTLLPPGATRPQPLPPSARAAPAADLRSPSQAPELLTPAQLAARTGVPENLLAAFARGRGMLAHCFAEEQAEQLLDTLAPLQPEAA